MHLSYGQIDKKALSLVPAEDIIPAGYMTTQRKLDLDFSNSRQIVI